MKKPHLTRDEFAALPGPSLTGSGAGRLVLPCDCDYYCCQGWVQVPDDDPFELRHWRQDQIEDALAWRAHSRA